jgi:hypothetical protein
MAADGANVLHVLDCSSNEACAWRGPLGALWKLESSSLHVPPQPTSHPIRDGARAMEENGYPPEVFFKLMTPKNEVVFCGSIADGLRSFF